ncbi:MAG TPA: cation:proton antiporter, partial [Synergistaceae bacterium]|nr:cation:proton antiporter [Synergistaceae bacterium]
MQDISVSTVAVVIQVLLYASVAYIALKRFKFPYTIGLVLIGLIIGAVVNIFGILPAFSRLHLTGNLILYALLPALIFDAALNMDVQLLKKNIVPVMVLAVPGLVVATLVSAWLVAAWTPLGMGAALVFGALISTTDPVAVIALFHELGAPKRLTMLVDGESLFNDATAIVMFAIVLGLVSSGAPFSVGTVLLAAVEFFLVFIGGLMVGVAVGWVVMG